MGLFEPPSPCDPVAPADEPRGSAIATHWPAEGAAARRRSDFAGKSVAFAPLSPAAHRLRSLTVCDPSDDGAFQHRVPTSVLMEVTCAALSSVVVRRARARRWARRSVMQSSPRPRRPRRRRGAGWYVECPPHPRIRSTAPWTGSPRVPHLREPVVCAHAAVDGLVGSSSSFRSSSDRRTSPSTTSMSVAHR